jgi:N-acetylglucosamine kinase-like BadF-type ATPase
VIVGIDIGGTKTHARVEDDAGAVLLDRSIMSADWQHGGHLHAEANVRALLALLNPVPGADHAPLVVGAHGLDSEAQTIAFSETLAAIHAGPALAVNDVELVGPAAGFDDAIAVIAGTGSKVVGHRADGTLVNAGGYGYILNDPGSAPALVRDAVRSLFDAVDEDEPQDALADALFAHFGVDEIVGLSNALTINPRVTTWGAAAPLVFAAADAGSVRAVGVIEHAASELARSVELVHRRGGVGEDVVCAGGVVSHQPRLFQALGEHMQARGLPHSLHLLDVPPVRGALALARRLTEAAPAAPFPSQPPSTPQTASRRKS